MQRKRMTVDTEVMILGIYTGLLLIAEFATTRNLKTGMIAHGCILVALLLHSTIAENRYFSNLYASLSIIPLIRILSLCIPLMHFEYILWFLIVGVPLFAAIFTCIYLQRIDLRCVGLKIPSHREVPLTWGIILLGIPVGMVEYYVLEPEFMIGVHASWVVPILILVICTGFLEELLFRGLLQHTFTEAVGMRGILIVSVIFGFLHLGNSWLDCVLAGEIGFIFALVVRKTGSIYGVSISHGVINVMLFLVMPYLALQPPA
jgi:membrane protease YdiL (CAAX protease family)